MARRNSNGTAVAEAPVPATVPAAKYDHPLANCIPRADRVVIRRDKKKTETRGGILLPDTAAGKQQLGTVHSVGPGRQTVDGKYVPVEVVPGRLLKAGDRVVLTSYAGMEINDHVRRDDDDEFIMLREDDILGVLE